MGQNKRISEMFKKPVLQFIALYIYILKKTHTHKKPNKTKANKNQNKTNK